MSPPESRLFRSGSVDVLLTIHPLDFSKIKKKNRFDLCPTCRKVRGSNPHEPKFFGSFFPSKTSAI